MPKPHTTETAREKLAQLAPHLSLVDFVPPSRGKSTFFDLRHNTEFQYDFKNLCNKVKKHPDFVFCRPREEYQADQSQSKEQAQEKLDKLTSNFKIVEYVSQKRGMSTFEDLRTGEVFQYGFHNLITMVRKNPDYVNGEKFVPEPKKISMEEAQQKLDEVSSGYKLLEYVPSKLGKCRFQEIESGREFEYYFFPLLNAFRRNPDYIPCPADENVRKEVIRKRRAKTESTLRERYGVSHPSQVPWFKEKLKQGYLDRLGVEHHLQTPEGLAKWKRAYVEKTGYECPTQNPEVKEKISKTFEKYEGGHPLRDPKIKERIKDTCIEKYGYPNPMMSEEIHSAALEKIAKTAKENGSWRVYEGKTIPEWAEEVGLSYSYLSTVVNVFGEESLNTVSKRFTVPESRFISLLDDLGVSYTQDRKLEGTSYRPDFVLPDHNLVIECDGLYWHSDAVKDRNNYHVKKLRAYEDVGYRALFFREDEIRDKFEVVSSIVKNVLKVNNERIFARKCQIEEIDSKWFSDRHLMGKGAGKCFGLKHKGEVVAGIQVKWVNKAEESAEISRFCTKSGTTVVGGFSKLVKHAVNEFGCRSLKTFIDRRYGRGEYLESLGFRYEGCYASFRWTDYIKTYGRMTHKQNSGYEKGLKKIWDCGQAKYVLYL